MEVYNNSTLNKRLGLSKTQSVTKEKQNRYVKNNPQISDKAKVLILNVHLPFEEISKLSGLSIGFVKANHLSAVESIITGKPKIGVKGGVKNPTLKKYQRQLQDSVVKKTPNKYNKIAKNLVVRKVVEAEMLSSSSPKSGDVLTLAYDCSFEIKLSSLKQLKNLIFNVYEFPYLPTLKKESETIFESQLKIRKKNPRFASKSTLSLKNINDDIIKYRPDSLSHAFLDYCDSYDKNKDAVEHLLKNNVVKKGGLVWLTFSQRRSKDFYKKIKKVVPKGRYEFLPFNNLTENEKGVYIYDSVFVLLLRRTK